MKTEHHSIRWLAWKLHVSPDLLKVLDAEIGDQYDPFPLTKNGKTRDIDNPSNALKLVQRRLRRLLNGLPLADFVHGCVSGRSPFTNAMCHVGQRRVASVDIRNFYPTVDPFMVYRVWRERVGLGPRLAALCTRLTTVDFHLPQGAPTSDALANHVLREVDERIQEIAAALDLIPSRYLDNIDLSGNRASEAIGRVIDALRAEGFSVRHKKTFVVGPSSSHVVTGYTTNRPDVPSVGRKQRDKARAVVHRLICARRRTEPTEDLENQVRGHLAHLMVSNPGTVARLRRQLNQEAISLKPRTRGR